MVVLSAAPSNTEVCRLVLLRHSLLGVAHAHEAAAA